MIFGGVVLEVVRERVMVMVMVGFVTRVVVVRCGGKAETQAPRSGGSNYYSGPQGVRVGRIKDVYTMGRGQTEATRDGRPRVAQPSIQPSLTRLLYYYPHTTPFPGQARAEGREASGPLGPTTTTTTHWEEKYYSSSLYRRAPYVH